MLKSVVVFAVMDTFVKLSAFEERNSQWFRLFLIDKLLGELYYDIVRDTF